MGAMQEHWSELPFPTLGDLSNPGIKLASLAAPTLEGGVIITAPPRKDAIIAIIIIEEKQRLYSWLL